MGYGTRSYVCSSRCMYTGSIRILDATDQELGSVPITLKVHEFELPAPRLEYSMYYRGKLADHNPTVSHEWKSTSQLIADLESMIAHGISNPTCYQRFWPKEDVERSSPHVDLEATGCEISRPFGENSA